MGRFSQKRIMICWDKLYPYKHFGSPIQVNSIKVRQPERAQVLLSDLARANGSRFSSYNRSQKLTRLAG